MSDEANVLALVSDYLEQSHPTNANGRMRAEPGAPLFVFVRTTLGCIWRFREDLAANRIRDLSRLAGREPPADAMEPPPPPPERLESMRRILEAPAAEYARLFYDPEAQERFSLRESHGSDGTPGASAIADVYLMRAVVD